MIPFDLEKFKAGAVAVDEDGIEYHFICQWFRDIMEAQFISSPSGRLKNIALPISYAKEHWHMKESKWIVFREFDSEEEAIAAHYELVQNDDIDWKIKEV
jgi:hypothetical protein